MLSKNTINYISKAYTPSNINNAAISIISGTMAIAKIFPNAYLAAEFGLGYSPILAGFLGIGTGLPLFALSYYTGKEEIIKIQSTIYKYGAYGIFKLSSLTSINFFSSIYGYYMTEKYYKEFFKNNLKMDDSSTNTTSKVLASISFLSTIISANWSMQKLFDIAKSKFYIYTNDAYKNEFSALESLKLLIYKNEISTQATVEALQNNNIKFFNQLSLNPINNDVKGNMLLATGTILGALAPWCLFTVAKESLSEVPKEWGFTLPEALQDVFAGLTWISLGSLRIYATVNVFDKISCALEAPEQIFEFNLNTVKNIINVGSCIVSLFYRIELAQEYPITENNKALNDFGVFATTVAPFFTDYWSVNTLFIPDDKDKLIDAIIKTELKIHNIDLTVVGEALQPLINAGENDA